jgi:hypothetical protein
MWKLGMSMRDVQIEAVKIALEFFYGNKVHTARALKISIRSLRNWVADMPELAQFRRKPHSRKENRNESPGIGE